MTKLKPLSEEPSNDFTESPPSQSSESRSRSPWWRDPTRLLAVVGTLLLRWQGCLSEEWTAAVLIVVLSSQVSQFATQLLRRRLSGKP